MMDLIVIIAVLIALLVFMGLAFLREQWTNERKRENELEEMAYIAYVTGWVDGSNDADTDFPQEYPGIREHFEQSMKNREGKVK